MPAKRQVPSKSTSRKTAARTSAPGASAKQPPAGSDRGEPFLRFHYPPSLRKRINEVLAAIEGADDPTRHVGALSAMATELTEAGLSYFFVEPLKAANAGFVIQQSAGFGISSAVMVLSPVIRNVMAWLDKDQLLVVAAHIRRFMQ
jgi:hypothetical protein